MTRSLRQYFLVCLMAVSEICLAAKRPASTDGPVTTIDPLATEGVLLPVNQLITPAGIQVELPGMRPQVIALSPDGSLLITSGRTHELVVIDPVKGTVLQHVELPEESTNMQPSAISAHLLHPDKEGEASVTGLVFSEEGSRLYLSNAKGSIKVFSVAANHQVSPLYSIPLPPTGLSDRTNDIPTGLAISADGKKLYVVLNVSNRLLEFDRQNRKPLRLFEVGNAPHGVVLVDGKAYVSNRGGRRPDEESLTGPRRTGTAVRVDPVRFVANEGSVSVIDLEKGKLLAEIMVGLQPSALVSSPDGKYVVVANSNSDSLSVIEVASNRVIETISLAWENNAFFGASPNALAFDPSGQILYVCNGTQNAVAVVAFLARHSKPIDLIPTGWYPSGIAYDDIRHMIHVANLKGTGAGSRLPEEKEKVKSSPYLGTLSLISLPKSSVLAHLTRTVFQNCRRAATEAAMLPVRRQVAARPVPERAGEPSLFKHVIYVIKEARSYDQVLGDIPEGNGRPSLCIFGEEVTPNQHKLAREFVLLDNTYCSGSLSADGHQWATAAFATDYMEKSFAFFPKNLPTGLAERQADTLAYAPTGFIWDHVLAHHKTFRDYGEFTLGETGWSAPGNRKSTYFTNFYNDFANGTSFTRVSSRAAIQSLQPYICTNTIGWNLDVPDQFRAAQFIKELEEFERSGTLPEFIIIYLPNDHTSGTRAGSPTPAAQVADNDLAFGKIIEAVSHSSFWKDTCIFGMEADSHDGIDHASRFRTTTYVASPYTRRRAVVHVNYNQPSLLRTIELILGLPPMNQMDAAANPMFACFTNQPDFTPYTAVENKVPLDQLNRASNPYFDSVDSE